MILSTGLLKSTLCALLFLVTSSGPGASAHPLSLSERSISNGVSLRILPLGDSITNGYKSTGGNGYRENLLVKLKGNSVEYIGSVHSGTMKNNHHEGHNGAYITNIGDYAKRSLPDRPNVVLVMAGTNDVNGGKDVATIPDRLGALIDQIIKACPDAAIIVAQLTPIKNKKSGDRAKDLNKKIPDIVAARAKKGKHVLVVDMNSKVTVNDLIDGLHPTNHGYNLMSEVWLKGIKEAGSKGWLKKPVKV